MTLRRFKLTTLPVVADWCRSTRQDLHIPQDKLAAAAGVHRESVWKLENGKGDPSYRIVALIVTTLEDLLREKRRARKNTREKKDRRAQKLKKLRHLQALESDLPAVRDSRQDT